MRRGRPFSLVPRREFHLQLFVCSIGSSLWKLRNALQAFAGNLSFSPLHGRTFANNSEFSLRAPFSLSAWASCSFLTIDLLLFLSF